MRVKKQTLVGIASRFLVLMVFSLAFPATTAYATFYEEFKDHDADIGSTWDTTEIIIDGPGSQVPGRSIFVCSAFYDPGAFFQLDFEVTPAPDEDQVGHARLHPHLLVADRLRPAGPQSVRDMKPLNLGRQGNLQKTHHADMQRVFVRRFKGWARERSQLCLLSLRGFSEPFRERATDGPGGYEKR